MADEENTGSPLHAEPILAVKDIIATLDYWHDVLGFTNKWTWGEPANYGGVSWNGVSVQFSHEPDRNSSSKGNAIFIRARKLESLYHFHQRQNAEIVEPLENKPWGMAGYTVREINGHYIIFAGAPLSKEKESSTGLPSTVRIVHRTPLINEYRTLTSAVGWSLYSNDATIKKLLDAALFAVVAEETISGDAIGCALLLGDDASFYYVKDVAVHPAWQRREIGSSMMKELNKWLDKNGADNALVGLITGEGLAPFYQQFGFIPAFSMIKYIQRNEKR